MQIQFERMQHAAPLLYVSVAYCGAFEDTVFNLLVQEVEEGAADDHEQAPLHRFWYCRRFCRPNATEDHCGRSTKLSNIFF